MAPGRNTEDQDDPNLCTESESVNDDLDQISGQPLRPCGFPHRKSTARQMTASTNSSFNLEKVFAMWASSTVMVWMTSAPGTDVPKCVVIVKRGKNDAVDAEAISEAVTRSTARFVPVKSAEQRSILMVHRTRDCWCGSVAVQFIAGATRRVWRIPEFHALAQDASRTELPEAVRG